MIEVLHRPVEPAQYTALRFGETLFLQGLVPSIGSVADAFDNALAETTVGLYKAECIADDSPFRIGPLRTVSDVEEATSAWVHWYNTDRLMHRLGRIPPTEYEPGTTLHNVPINRSHTNNSVCIGPGMVHIAVRARGRVPVSENQGFAPPDGGTGLAHWAAEGPSAYTPRH